MVHTLDLDAHSDASTRRALSDLSLSVAKCKKIVVVTGAGISCSCGIPDFRSSDGLYALVKQQHPDAVLKGRDLFDAALFRDPTSTSVFYTFISKLKQSIDSANPSATHRFIKTLDSKKKLLRSYTQNIDGLEERAGLLGSSSKEAKVAGLSKLKVKPRDVRNVQLHGDIHRVRCTLCSADLPYEESYMNAFLEGAAPQCPECVARSKAREERSARALKIGTLRPAIVLYDEPHPLGDVIGTIQTADVARKPDMLIIMGTSLKVHGLKKLVKDFARVVHDSAPRPGEASSSKTAKSWMGKVVFVNKTPLGAEWNGIIDYHVAGETDKWSERVIEDWKKMRPVDWEVQQSLTAGKSPMQVMKPGHGSANVLEKKKKKKKKGKEVENIPPHDKRGAIQKESAKSKPTKGTKTAPIPMPPPSPSKRRTSMSHYSTGDASPPKKRDLSMDESGILFEETQEPAKRGLLFGDNTNILPDLVADPFDCPKDVPARVTRSRGVAQTAKKRMLARSKSQVYVQVP